MKNAISSKEAKRGVINSKEAIGGLKVVVWNLNKRLSSWLKTKKKSFVFNDKLKPILDIIKKKTRKLLRQKAIK